MQDVTESSHEFQTLGPDPSTKHQCLATLLCVAGFYVFYAFLGAAVKEALRWECPFLVESLPKAWVAATVMPLSGGRLFAGGHGENVLISSLGRRPQKNALLTTVQTAEAFELSFDITPHDGAPADEWRNILHFGNSNGQRLPGFWLFPGSTKLDAQMSRQDETVSCDPEDALPVGQVTRVGVRLVGNTFTVSFNGHQVCSTDGFFENRVPAQRSVDVWFSSPWDPAADVTVANLVYTPIWACGPVGV